MSAYAYLGPEGTFTDAAVQSLIARRGDTNAQTCPLPSPSAALDAVRSGQADFACVPVENSVDGPVTPTFDALTRGDRLQIIAEHELPITFAILVRPGTRREDIHTLASHPVGLAQVRHWAQRHLPGVAFHTYGSTAAAATAVAQGEADAAAAPARAGELLGLDALEAGVADVAGARTRFALVSRPCALADVTGHDRTSVVFKVPSHPGSLVECLTEFSVRGVNLTRIESRPTRRTLGEYDFHIDLAGHINEDSVGEALAALHRRCEWVRFLGSWPIPPGQYAETLEERVTEGQAAAPPACARRVLTPLPRSYGPSYTWVRHQREGRDAEDEQK